MIFDTTTTLEEDLAIWLRWHKITPHKEVVNDFKICLKNALKRDESILNLLDTYVLSKRSYKSNKENKGRDYERENVKRIMRAKKVSEEEAYRIFAERRAKKELAQIKKSKK